MKTDSFELRLSPYANYNKQKYKFEGSHGHPQNLFQGGATSTFCLSFSDCWQCNANGRTQKENDHYYVNSCLQCLPVRKLYTEPWASEGFFPGGATRGFFLTFSRGPKWWNLIFPTRNLANNLFCCKFQNPGGVKTTLPTPMHWTNICFSDHGYFKTELSSKRITNCEFLD